MPNTPLASGFQWDKMSPAEFQQLQELASYSTKKLQDVLNEFCEVKKQSPDGDHTYDLKLARKLFEEFVIHYKRNYTGDIREHKYKAFYDNLGRINAINQNLPGTWFAVIGPYTDLTYMEWVKANNLTKTDYTNVGSGFRNVINCTDRRGYLFERFSDMVRDDYESRNNGSQEYEYSNEDLEQNGTAQYEYYDSGENQTRIGRSRVKRIHRHRT